MSIKNDDISKTKTKLEKLASSGNQLRFLVRKGYALLFCMLSGVEV